MRKDPDTKKNELGVKPDALSRRSVIAGAAMVGVGAVCMSATRARAQSKQKPTDVQYQEQPKGEDHCEKCALFAPPDSCQAVEGKISPQGWCSLYSPKA